MRVLHDENTGLTFCGVDKDCCKSPDKYSDVQFYNDCNRILDTWDSDNIKAYITAKESPLGEYMKLSNREERMHQQFFVFDGYDLVSTIAVNGGHKLYDYVAFSDYVVNLFGVRSLADKDSISIKQAKQILEHAKDKSHSTLRYIIVNPKYQGQGYGTRTMKSLINNIEFFSQTEDNATIRANVANRNVVSSRLMKSMKMKKLVEDHPNRYISTYYRYLEKDM